MKIDPEFKALIYPLQEHEYNQLEESIKREGCRDPLVVWGDTLLDGHHRLQICDKHNIAYNTTGLAFDSREDAKLWIIDNQIARRNLTMYQLARLVDAKKEIYAKQAEQRMLVGGGAQNSGQGRARDKDTDRKLASDAGLSHDTIHRSAVIAEKADEETKAKLRAGAPDISINKAYMEIRATEKEAARKERRQANLALVDSAANLATLEGVFSTIVIDPPWDWGDEGDVDQMGRARPTYKTIPYDDLASMPIKRLSDKDAHIYLWITNRSLPKGFALIEQWGFRYVTCLTWCKPSFGMGNYFRGSTEHLLFGVKGSLPLERKDVGTWFEAPRGQRGHSSKPQEAYDLIESCSPGPYIDIFARNKREGWASWGAEAD